MDSGVGVSPSRPYRPLYPSSSVGASGASRARKIFLFSLHPFSFYIMFSPHPPPGPSSPSSRPFYLSSPLVIRPTSYVPCPPPHSKDEVENVKRIMLDEGRRRTDGRTTDEALINNDNSSFEHSAPVIALQIQNKMQKKKKYYESTK